MEKKPRLQREGLIFFFHCILFFLLSFTFSLLDVDASTWMPRLLDISEGKRNIIRRIVENNWRNVISVKEIEEGKMLSLSLPDSVSYSLRIDITAYRRKELLLFRGMLARSPCEYVRERERESCNNSLALVIAFAVIQPFSRQSTRFESENLTTGDDTFIIP